MKKFFLKKKLVFLLFFLPQLVWAQDMKDLESVADTSERIKQLKVKSLSDLQKLTPYPSISVLQKRYLPKTFRGEFNLSVTSIINHTFFYSSGISARAGFFLREDHSFGLEALGLFPPIVKLVTEDLIYRGIFTDSLVLSQFYGAAYYKWSPVFGKFAFVNNKIIYFDMYMTVGAGATRFSDREEIIERVLLKRLRSPKKKIPKLAKDFFPTGSLAVGQVFALSQNWAFNWELKFLFTYLQFEGQNSKVQMEAGLLLGVNYYFPKAGYR